MAHANGSRISRRGFPFGGPVLGLSLAPLVLGASASAAGEPPFSAASVFEPSPFESAATAATAGVVELPEMAGFVATSGGLPLPGALVSVVAAEDPAPEARFVVTDDDGRFHVRDAPPGLYSLRAYLAGFLPSPRATVRVSRGAAADTLLMHMAVIGSGPGAGTLSELRWLLQRGRRNVLKEKRAAIDLEDDWGDAFGDDLGETRLPPFRAEVGFLAASEGAAAFAGGHAGESGVAYTRFELPSAARGRWEAEARLQESAVASWATNLGYRMDEFDGHRFAAGIGYRRHVYRDASDYRPPAAPILNTDLLEETGSEWDASAYAEDELTLGPARFTAGVSYRRFSYLAGHSGFAPRAVFGLDVGGGFTVVGGFTSRVEGPIGEDAEFLSRVAHADLRVADPSDLGIAPAQRSVRYQAGLQRGFGDIGLIAVRAFRESTNDQILRRFEAGPAHVGRFEVENLGDVSARGFAVDLIREMAPAAPGLDASAHVSWVVTSVAILPGPDAGPDGAAGAAAIPDDGALVHDLSARAAGRLRSTGTRLSATVRTIRHPGLLVFGAAGPTDGSPDGAPDRSTRYDLQLTQEVPFADWRDTEFELSLGVRGLFFQDLIGRSVLDELAVVGVPRRIVGGLAVRF